MVTHKEPAQTDSADSKAERPLIAVTRGGKRRKRIPSDSLCLSSILLLRDFESRQLAVRARVARRSHANARTKIEYHCRSRAWPRYAL